MCSNQKKQYIKFSIVKLCAQRLHFPVRIFPAYTCGMMTSQKPQKQQIKLYKNKYSWLVSEETFLCLLNFIRNSQAETIGHCSLTNQYNTSQHPLTEQLLKLWSMSEYQEPVISHGAIKSLVLGRPEWLSILPPLHSCLQALWASETLTMARAWCRDSWARSF